VQTSGVSGKKLIKLDSLTSLRFFAAAMIVLGHGHKDFGSFGLATAFPLNQGVSFFFVLSGFVLAYAYPELIDWRQRTRFIWARFARIWPAYFVSLLIMLIALPTKLWSVSASHPFGFSLANICLLHAWIPLRESYLGLNGVSWSLSTEFFFYLCFPWLIYRLAASWPFKLSLVAGLTCAIVVLANYYQLPSGHQYSGVGSYALLYISPLSRLFEFVCGIVACTYYKSEKEKTAKLTLAGATLLELSALFLTIVTLWLIPVLLASPWVQAVFQVAGLEWLLGSGGFLSFTLLILVFSWQRGLVSKLLSHPLLVLLGEISFSLYLVHSIVLKYYRYHLASFISLPQNLLAAAYWLISLILAYLLYSAVEMPCRAFLVRLPDRFDRSQESPQSWIHFRMKPVLSFLFLGGLVLASLYQPSTVLKSLSRDAVARELRGAQLMAFPARFANNLELTQLSHRAEGEKIIFTFLWHADTEVQLKECVGVHFLDQRGVIIHHADYELDLSGSTVAACSNFITRISAPVVNMTTADKLGIALYVNVKELYRVTAPNTDWGGRRLIIPLGDNLTQKVEL